MIQSPSNSFKIAVLAGLVISSLGVFWLSGMPHHSFSFLERLGYVSALASVFGFWLLCWSAIVACWAMAYKWSPATFQ